jgi:hypothetical protein
LNLAFEVACATYRSMKRLHVLTELSNFLLGIQKANQPRRPC